MATLQFLKGHSAHLARIAITWRRVFNRSHRPDDAANATRVMGLALGGAR